MSNSQFAMANFQFPLCALSDVWWERRRVIAVCFALSGLAVSCVLIPRAALRSALG